jgi:hypothetical protein
MSNRASWAADMTIKDQSREARGDDFSQSRRMDYLRELSRLACWGAALATKGRLIADNWEES